MIPPPKHVAPHWDTDPNNDPITSPGTKLTPEQMAILQAAAPDADTYGKPKPMLATDLYVKSKVEVVAQRVDDTEKFTESVLAKLKALGGLLVAVVAVTASVLLGLDTRAQSKADAVADAGATRDKKQDERIEKLEAASQRTALEGVRTTVMLEQLTEKARLPVPPPVMLPDGGR